MCVYAHRHRVRIYALLKAQLYRYGVFEELVQSARLNNTISSTAYTRRERDS